MTRIVVTALALCALAPSTASAKPPSFTRWNDAWLTHHFAWQIQQLERCSKLFPTDNHKAGNCFVPVMAARLRRDRPKWEQAMADMTRDQSAPCRKAIHKYLLASRISQNATLDYLNSHTHVDIDRIIYDMAGRPYSRTFAHSLDARWRADRICGQVGKTFATDVGVVPVD